MSKKCEKCDRKADRRGLCRNHMSKEVCRYCEKTATKLLTSDAPVCDMHYSRKRRGTPMWPEARDPVLYLDVPRQSNGKFAVRKVA